MNHVNRHSKQHSTVMPARALLTCMWSPARTIRVLFVANARGIMVSHSMAWAASSNRMCVKNPTKYSVNISKAYYSNNKGRPGHFAFLLSKEF